MTTIDELQTRIGLVNQKNGFNEAETIPLEFRHFYWVTKLALVITEVAEAIEEIRKGHAIDHQYVIYPDAIASIADPVLLEAAVADYEARGGLPKPEGAPAEIADAFIRLLGIMYEAKLSGSAVAEHKIDYNESRPFKHGGKLF